jgi:hypothetical protein
VIRCLDDGTRAHQFRVKRWVAGDVGGLDVFDAIPEV